MKKLPPRTPWFPASVEPVCPGIYEYVYGPGSTDKGVHRFRFDGGRWFTGPKHEGWETATAFAYRDQWRGLTRPA